MNVPGICLICKGACAFGYEAGCSSCRAISARPSPELLNDRLRVLEERVTKLEAESAPILATICKALHIDHAGMPIVGMVVAVLATIAWVFR